MYYSFLLLKILFRWFLADFTKCVRSKKHVFWQGFQYFRSPRRRKQYFSKQTKKIYTPIWSKLLEKKFSHKTLILDVCGRKTSGHFLPLRLLFLIEGGTWKFWVYDNFSSTGRDLCILKVSELMVEPFLRNLRNGDGYVYVLISFLFDNFSCGQCNNNDRFCTKNSLILDFFLFYEIKRRLWWCSLSSLLIFMTDTTH